jgi:hypothetical protein
MSDNQVAAFIDYENIRVGLWRHFQKRIPQDISVSRLLECIKQVYEELGTLYEAQVFGDWTLRPEDVRVIESTPKFRAQLVLRSVSKKDRTDPVMNFAIDDTFREKKDISTVLLCAGDSDYCEVMRRGRRLDKNLYVCAVGPDTAPELLSLAKAFYPIEQRLGLKSKEEERLDIAKLDPAQIDRWTPLVKVLDHAEERLPSVIRSYFINTWMMSGLGYGETFEQKAMALDLAEESGIIVYDNVPHPETGRPVRTLRLDRNHHLVKAILARG